MSKGLTKEEFDLAGEMSSAEINPVTNLPENTGAGSKKSGSLSLEEFGLINKVTDSQSNAVLGKGDLGLDPDEFDFQLKPNQDNEELRAQDQSVIGMLAKGTGRLVTSTATKFLAGLGYLGSAVPAIMTGDMSTMLDNGFSAAFNSLEETAKEAMPIYKTKKYLDGNILEQMATPGFWFDDIVDGTAFMISSMIGAKGMSAIAKGAGTYSKIAKAFSKATTAAKTGQAAELLTVPMQKFVDASTLATISTFNSVSEAAFEAKDTKDSVLASLQKKVELGELSAEEANIRASEAAKTTFWTNMVLLAPSNLLETSMFFKGTENVGLDRVFKEGATAGKTGKEIIKDIPAALTKKQMAGTFAKDALLSSVTEGAYEENMQSALQSYTQAKAEGKEENTGLVQGLMRNWVENFGTDEGQKAIVLGSIIGIGPGGYGGVQEAKSKNAATIRLANAKAQYMDMASTGINDLLKTRTEKDAEGNVIEKAGQYETDEQGYPQLDPEKVKAKYGNSQIQYVRYLESLKALAGGNKGAHDFIKHDTFSDYAFKVFNEGGDTDAVQGLIDKFAAREVEDLTEAGFITEDNKEQEDYINGLKDKYSKTAKSLDEIYRSIKNNYGGLNNFGKSNGDRIRKELVTIEQYQEASKQLFLSEKIKELENTVRKGEAAGNGRIAGVEALKNLNSEQEIKEGKKAAKLLEQAKSELTNSELKLKDLLSFKKQKDRYIEEQRILKEESEGRNIAEDNDSVATKAATTKSDTPVKTNLSPTLSTTTLTPAQAQDNGYVADLEKSKVVNGDMDSTNPSYFYKKNEKDGSVHIIYTDGTEEGNIVNERTLIAKEVQSNVTGNRGRLTLNFMQDKLEKAYTTDFETGEVEYHDLNRIERTLGRPAKVSDSAMVFYNIMPQLGGKEYTKDKVSTISNESINALGDFEIQQKSLEQHRNDAKAAITSLAQEVTTRSKEDAKVASKDVKNTNAVYGVEKMTPKELFEVSMDTYVPAEYNDKLGYIKQSEGSTVFVSTEEGNKEYIIGGAESSLSFQELGVSPLSHTSIGVEYETDRRVYPILINGRYYKNPFYGNPSDSIKVRNGVPVSVTLVDVNGVKHVFTEDTVVQPVAYFIEVNEAVEERIFDYLVFGTESDALIVRDPKTGVDYAVYKSNGQYEVYYLREGEATKGYKKVKPQGLIYNRITKETRSLINQAIDATSKSKAITLKEIQNEVRSNVKDVRPATAGEALTIPSQSEVSSSPRVAPEAAEKQTTEVEQKTTKQLEEEVRLAVEEKAAIEAEAQRRLVEQETVTEEATEFDNTVKSGDTVESMNESESKDQSKDDEFFSGVINSNDALAYIHFDRDSKQFKVNNVEFLTHAINNAVGNATVTAEIDYDYREFWNAYPRLEASIKAGSVPVDKIEETLDKDITDSKVLEALSNEYKEFNKLVDMIPIKYTYQDGTVVFENGIYAHQSNYKHLTVEAGELIGLSEKEAMDARLSSKKDKMMAMRNTRRQILTEKLKGNSITFPVERKTVGHYNTDPNTNISLSQLLEQLGDAATSQEIGLGLTDGNIYIAGDERRAGKGSKGNIYWRTNRTANGESVIVKLNPSKISKEHAKIVLEALKQQVKGKGNDKFVGVGVTGGLRVKDVLKHLITHGKDVTEVPANNKSKSRYIQKQLWTTPEGGLKFGETLIDLNKITAEQEKAFIEWASINKNYPVSKPFLGKKLAAREDFTIGSTMSYNVETDNYASFLINSDTLMTRLRVVPGTKSITNNPTIILNETAPSITEKKVVKKQVAPITKPEIVETAKESNQQATKKTTELRVAKVSNIAKIQRSGTTVYFYNPQVSNTKYYLGTVEDGKFILETQFEGVLENLNDRVAKLGAIDLTDAASFKIIEEDASAFQHLLHADLPATTVEVVEKENEAAKVVTAESVIDEANPVIEVKGDELQDQSVNTSNEIDPNGPTSLEDIDTYFRTVPDSPIDQRPYNPTKATKWLRSKLGKDFDIEIVDGLIELAQDKHAFGQARVDSILLSNAAEIGTEYHEAFHRVSLFLMNEVDRQAIYKKARIQYKLKDATDKIVEEHLAEEYRNFMLLKEEGFEKKGIIPTIKRFFNNIFNYIKTIFVGANKLSEVDIQQLFRYIDEGRFRYKKVDKTKLESLKGKYANYEIRGKAFSNIQSGEEYREVINFLFRNLMQASGLVTAASDIQTRKGVISINLKEGTQDISKLSYSLLKERLINLKGQYNNVAALSTNTAEQIKASKFRDLISEIIVDENFDIIKQDLENYLNNLNIRRRADSQEIDEESGEVVAKAEIFGIPSFESSAKDNVAANIKLLLSILPDHQSNNTKTGLPAFAEFSPVWAELLRSSTNVVTTQDLMDILEEKAKGSFTFETLLKYIKQDYSLRIQLWNTVSQARLDFINSYITEENFEINIYFGDAMVKTAASEEVKSWNQNFARNSKLFSFNQGKDPIPNPDYFNTLRKKYNIIKDKVDFQMKKYNKISNYAVLLGDLKALLNEVGITISEENLGAIMSSKGQNQDTAFDDFISNKIQHIFSDSGSVYKLMNDLPVNKGVTFNNVLRDEKGVAYIANQISALDPMSLGESLLAHQGKMFYLVTQHTNLTNQINDFKKNPEETFAQKQKAVYNTNSTWINYFRENPSKISELQLKTVASIYKENEQDEGRGYQDVTNIEEYLIRLSANFNGYTTLPTPADRSSYQYLKGVPKVEVQLDSQGNVSDNVIEQFVNYFKDERERIILTKSQVENVLNAIDGADGSEAFDATDLVENLHFTMKDPYKGRDVVKEGEVVIATNEVGEWVRVPVGSKAIHGNGKLLKTEKVNDKGEATWEYAGRGAKFITFTNRSGYKSVPAYMQGILKERIQKSLDYAVENGVITESNGVYYNNLIPSTIIESKLREEGATVDSAIRNIIADNTVNTVVAGLEMSKMLTSDIASFKSFDDYIKRITGYTSTGSNLATEIPANTYQNDELIIADQYNVTTFNSHVVSSSLYDELVERHAKYYVEKDGISKEDAIERAEEKLSSYKATDQTDAQTYITNEMYRALAVKLGEWNDLKEQAYQLLTSGKELKHAQMISLYNLVSEPLKLTYMKTYQNGKQSYSVFDKMSLATLYRPFVEGTQLEELVDRMELKGKYEGKGLDPIHQVKFHTAEKSGNKDRRNIFKDGTEKEFTDLGLVTVYKQDFKNLRKQLNTAPHETSHIALGSQMRKIGISNVDFEADYVNKFDDKESMNGRQVVEEVHSVISELSDRGVEDFKKDMYLDDNFQISDKAGFINKLKAEARKANMPQHIVDSLKLNSDGNNFYLDLDSMPDARKWIQSRIISLIKKATIDTELPGGSFIQMSDLGLRSIDKSDELKWGDKDGFIETFVSVNLFKHIIPGFATKTHEQRVEWLDSNPNSVAMGYRVPTQAQNSTMAFKVKKWLPENMGDIIVLPKENPAVTGSDYDVDKVFVVRHNYKDGKRIKYLTLDNSSSIERANAYTDLALKSELKEINKKYREKAGIAVEGIDTEDYKETLKIIRKSHKDSMNLEIQGIKDQWVKDNLAEFEKRPIIKQNTTEAVQNRLLDMYFTVWHSDSHLIHRTQPLGYGTEILKDLAYEVRNTWEQQEDISGSPLAYLSPEEQVDVKSRFKFGARGIGPNALAGAHHILSQSVDLGLFEDIGAGNTTKENIVETSFPVFEGDLNIKNIFSVNPIKKVDVKAKSKAKISTKYAGFGPSEVVSSTATYAEQAKELANTGNYTSKDVVFVSVPGKRGGEDVYMPAIDKTIAEVRKALKGGAALITDNIQYTDSNSYNIGEKKLKMFLENLGVSYTEIEVDENLLGVWNTTPPSSVKKLTSLSGLKGKDNEYITEWFSALLDAHMDIGADPWIAYLNANAYTNPVITLLIRAGVGGRETFRFIAQPILKDVSETQSNKDNKLGIDAKEAKVEALKKYKQEFIRLGGNIDSIPSGKLAFESMIHNQEGLVEQAKKAGENRKNGIPLDIDYYRTQLTIYNGFEYLLTFSDSLKQAILASRADTKSFGSQLSAVNLFRNKIEKLSIESNSGSGIRNFDRLFSDTFLGTMTDNSVGMVQDSVGATLLEGSPAFVELHRKILDITGMTYAADEKFVNKVSSAIYTQVASEFFVFDANTNPTGMKREEVDKLFKGNTSIPKIIEEIQMGTKWPQAKGNAIFSIFTPVYRQDGPSFLSVRKPEDPFHINNIVSGWRELYVNEDTRQFALDLFKYSYFTSGFKSGANSFHNLVPAEILIDTGYNDFIKRKKVASRQSSAFAYMMDEIMVNSWSEKEIVSNFKSSDIQEGIGQNSMITLPYAKFGIGTGDGTVFGKPYLKNMVEGDIQLYKFGGYTVTGDETKLIYYRIPKKSIKYDRVFNIVENGLSRSTEKRNYDIPYNINESTFLQMATQTSNSTGRFLNEVIAGAIQVDSKNDRIVNTKEEENNKSSDQLYTARATNPIQAVPGITEGIIQMLTELDGEVGMSMEIRTGIYSLPNKQMIHLENQGNGQYIVSSRTTISPTLEEVNKRIEEC